RTLLLARDDLEDLPARQPAIPSGDRARRVESEPEVFERRDGDGRHPKLRSVEIVESGLERAGVAVRGDQPRVGHPKRGGALEIARVVVHTSGEVGREDPTGPTAPCDGERLVFRLGEKELE